MVSEKRRDDRGISPRASLGRNDSTTNARPYDCKGIVGGRGRLACLCEGYPNIKIPHDKNNPRDRMTPGLLFREIIYKKEKMNNTS